MAGMITVGSPKDYVCLVQGTDGKCDPKLSIQAYDAMEAAGHVRNILFKDAQIIQSLGKSLNWADQNPGFCGDAGAMALTNLGSCLIDPALIGNKLDESRTAAELDVQPTSRWLFTLNGQEYPDITIPPATQQIWRMQNASANITYRLSLRRETGNGVVGTRIGFQVLNMDGAGISLGAGTGTGAIKAPRAQELLLMPGSRAEILVSYDASEDGCTASACPASDTFYQLVTEGFQAGYAKSDADVWPRIALARINFKMATQTAAVAQATIQPTVEPAAQVLLNLDRASLTRAVAENCMLPLDASAQQVADKLTLPPRWRRRVYFGIYKPNDNYESFVLGTTLFSTADGKEFDIAGRPIDATNKVRLSEINMMTSLTNLCVLKGNSEVWELINASREVHNFHIHQSKFTVLRKNDGSADMRTPSDIDAQVLPSSLLFKQGNAQLKHDTIVVPRGHSSCADALKPIDPTVAEPKDFYLDPSPLDGVTCDEPNRGNILIRIPFRGQHLTASVYNNKAQPAKFVYHCHILEHEDKGMMSSITVLDPDHLQ
jgi:FtsP/CotA-like multicopper oxidase with cupredoxin domain